MNIYILKPFGLKPHWEPWYDKAFGFVVVANSETKAREIASEYAGDEDRTDSCKKREVSVWLDPKITSCRILRRDKEKLVLRDFRSA